jgi:uncharacterized protein YdeI (YjbR/CyaY-like superfamily)
MTRTDAFQRIEVASADELRAWLEENHGQEASVWAVTWKKGAEPDRHVCTDDILDAVLSYGWVDGIRRKLDDARTMQLIAPRRAQHWSRSYKVRAARLIAEGLMRSPGLAAIEEGRRSGLWTFMDDVDDLIVPDDLADALAAAPPATDRFAASAPSYRRNVLRWIKLARTPATRAKRIAAAAEAAAENRRLPQM